MSDDLATWLRAQLDEDERVAREAAADFAEESGLRWRVDSEGNVSPAEPVDNSSVAIGSWGGPIGPAAEHIARHDPARVLREVEAKRRILGEVVDEATGLDIQVDSEFRVGTRDTAAEPYLGDVLLKLLALPYADRSGYREKWRP